jgi:hypothetical protein
MNLMNILVKNPADEFTATKLSFQPKWEMNVLLIVFGADYAAVSS